MQVPSQTIIDVDKFAVSEPWKLVVIISIIVLIITKAIGDQVGSRKSPFLDSLIDVINLLSAASIVAAVRNTPLVSSFSQSLAAKISSSKPIFDQVAIGLSIVLVAATIFFAFKYIRSNEGLNENGELVDKKKEEAKWMVLFAISLQVVAVLFDPLNPWLIWWLNNVVGTLWEWVDGISTTIANTRVNL